MGETPTGMCVLPEEVEEEDAVQEKEDKPENIARPQSWNTLRTTLQLTDTCTCIYIYVHVHTCIHVYIRTRTYTCIC